MQQQMEQPKIYRISENGFLGDKVSIPECRVKATGYLEAVNKLAAFLETRILTPDIELITPVEKIAFD